jgi:hypothetical protein
VDGWSAIHLHQLAMTRQSFSWMCLLIVSPRIAHAETPLDESNSWAFAATRDLFTDEAELDLRYLNEKQSGESGFVRLSEDRNSFVRGDGQPVRFWIVGTDAHGFALEDMDRHARWPAKLDVNMTRLHPSGRTPCFHQSFPRR